MKPEKLLVPLAAVAALYFLFTKRAVNMLQYFISTASLSFEGISPVLHLGITVQNPSNETFTLKSFVGTISANGKVIGTVSSFTAMDILAASQIKYPLEIRLALVGVVSDIAQIFQGGGIGQVITFNGFVNASGVVLPVNLSYNIA